MPLKNSFECKTEFTILWFWPTSSLDETAKLVPGNFMRTFAPAPLTRTGRLLPDDALLRQLQNSLGTSRTIERELGGGGMSRVYVAVENRFQRRVVIKVLSPELSEGLSGERSDASLASVTGSTCAAIPWPIQPRPVR